MLQGDLDVIQTIVRAAMFIDAHADAISESEFTGPYVDTAEDMARDDIRTLFHTAEQLCLHQQEHREIGNDGKQWCHLCLCHDPEILEGTRLRGLQ